ncbi:hypothetical protein PINS_up006970 [Pythium insidiosum]|nr:hypothetical protein PINS_up006970 [Pythium insidiosum]
MEEHDRFLEAMRLFPYGPWKRIADHIGTRSIRQVQSHAQKYEEKILRRARGLSKRSQRKMERRDHRIDDAAAGQLLRPDRLSALPGAHEVYALPRPGWHSATTTTQGPSLSLGDVELAAEPSSLPSLEDSLDYLLQVLP